VPKTDDQPDDPFQDLVLDEDFVKAAEHKEGSARARMLAARWKRTPPADTSWRAPVPLKQRRNGRRRWQLPLFVALAIGLVLVALNAKKIHDWAFSKAPGARAGAGTNRSVAPALTAGPTAAPPTPFVEQSPDLQHPFAGSPADAWPSGAAGIALPAAKPIGVFSAHTVAKDEQLVKDYLVAAYLDPKTIAGGYPEAALALLDPGAEPRVRRVLDHPAPNADAIMLTSRFDPRAAVPLGDVRVQGLITLSGDGDHGLDVRADFLFVYASHPVGSTDEIERSIARRVITFRFYDPARYQTTPGKVWIETTDGYTGNQLCRFTGGYLIPYFHLSQQPSSSATTAAPDGTTVDPYDLSKPPAHGASAACDTDTRD
jgi:hypothetical protein